jgi:hypothetical protein
MSLEFAHGAIQWNSADGVGTIYSISGLSFQPKALRFYWMGMGSPTDLQSSSVHARMGVGFADSALGQRCVAIVEADNAGTSFCGSLYRNDAVVATLSPLTVPAADGHMSLDAINSGGFDLRVLDAAPANITIFWEAWGGSDITVSKVVDIAEPAAIGNVDYTVTGFVAADTDQVVMFAGCQSTAVSGTAADTDAGLCVGFASSGNVADNCVVGINNDDASTTIDCDAWSLDGECLGQIVVGGGTVTARARLTQFNTNGFRLNWAARALSNRRYIALAIKGGQWKAGGFVMDTTTIGNTGTISGLPFQPKGVCMIDAGATETAAGSSVALARLKLGTGSSPSSRRSMGYISSDAAATSAVSVSVDYDSILNLPDLVAGVDLELDLDSINSDGFTVIVDWNGGGTSASDWKGYLTFGDAPGGAVDLVVADASHVQSADNTVLTTVYNLTVAEATHSQLGDNAVLTQVHMLAVQEASHAQVGDSISLIPNLNIAEALHGQSGDNLTLSSAGALIITDATHAQSTDGIIFTQEHNVIVQDAAHTHSADALELVQIHHLVLGDGTHAQAAESLLLDTPPLLVIQDALHGGGGGTVTTPLIISVME